MAYTEFYCQNGGSNVNAGSTNNNTPTYSKAHGNWTNATGIFTVQDGTNPSSSVSVGQWGAIMVDGGTVAAYIGRITAVQNANNGTITLNTSGVGTKPANQTATATITVGGAWQGPNGASGFPLTLASWGANKDATGNQTRLNLKNDQTYSISSSFAFATGGNVSVTQGYSGSVGDGGKATIDGGTSTGALISSFGLSGNFIADIIFTTSITTGTSDLVTTTVSGVTITRCVFKGARGRGAVTTSGNIFVECEFYDCNKSNSAGLYALNIQSGSMIRCFVHDNGGSNTDGININAAPSMIEDCVIDTNGNNGIVISATTRAGLIQIKNNDFYNNTSDAINIQSGATNNVWIENCNFIKSGGAAINNSSAVSSLVSGFAYNNGYGAGTQANGSGDTLGNLSESGKITYASNVAPWIDGPNGDFRLNLGTALCAGRGAFTQIQGYSSPNTVGYPDIGSAQAIATPAGSINASTSTLRDGFVHQTYYVLAEYTSDFTISVTSGALPGGLSLSQPTSSSWLISGTPTTVESASAVLTVVNSAGGSGTFTMNIQVYADPDEGIGGMIGG